MKRQVAVAIGLLAFFLLAGCVSQPKKKPSPQPTATPEPTPTPSAAVEAPEALKAEAEELRQACVDYGLNESMREDYLKAEESYVKGVENYEKDNALSASSFESAIALYRDLLSKGLASLVDEEKAKAEEMRAAAAAQNAESASPDQMAAGDASYGAAEVEAGMEDADGALNDFRAAVLSYQIAYERSRAVDARDRIDSNQWSEYDPGNYELAGQKFAEGDERFAGDPSGSLDSVQEALLRYNLVLKKGWEFTLGESRTLSEAEKEKADGIKSDRAAADEYAEAEAAYEDALAMEASERFEEANTAYELSADMFALTYQTAKEKMDRADGALEALRAKRDESKRLAEEGDAAIQAGGSDKGGSQ